MILMVGSGENREPKNNKMKAKRKRHEPEFKARVALEALKGEKTIQQIAKEYEIHPVQVSDWKKAMIERMPEIFSSGRKKSPEDQYEREKAQLHAKIGQQAVEIDFLTKKSKQLGL
jgi:transposase-like protein